MKIELRIWWKKMEMCSCESKLIDSNFCPDCGRKSGSKIKSYKNNPDFHVLRIDLIIIKIKLMLNDGRYVCYARDVSKYIKKYFGIDLTDSDGLSIKATNEFRKFLYDYNEDNDLSIKQLEHLLTKF